MVAKTHHCHAIGYVCPKPIHLYSGVGKNCIFAFHFTDDITLDAYLHESRWTFEQIAQLHETGEVKQDDEWARLEEVSNAS